MMNIFPASVNSRNLSDVVPLFALFAFPVGLLASCYFYPFWERLGFEWNLLLLSELALMAYVLLVPSLRRDLYEILWFSRLKSLLIVLFAIATIIFVSQPSLGHLPGYLSGLIYIIIFPFLLIFCRSCWIQTCRQFLLALCLFVVFVENILLSSSIFLGIGINDSFLFGEVFPRVFINTRDGNFFALVLFSLIFYEFVCSKAPVIAVSECRIVARFRIGSIVASLVRHDSFLSFGYVCVFYNCFVTHGRGLILSIVLGLILVLVRIWSQISLQRLLLPILLSCLLAAVGYWVFCMISSSYGDVEVASILFRSTSSNRFVLWSAWLNSFFDGNWITGRGFDHFPATYLPQRILNSSNVHNLFLQIVVDMGLLGVMSSVLIVKKTCRWIWSTYLERDAFCIFTLAAFGVQFFVAAPLQWPAAVWGINVLIMLLYSRGQLLTQSSTITKAFVDTKVKIPDSVLIWMMGIFLVFSAMSIYLVDAKFNLALPKFLMG